MVSPPTRMNGPSGPNPKEAEDEVRLREKIAAIPATKKVIVVMNRDRWA